MCGGDVLQLLLGDDAQVLREEVRGAEPFDHPRRDLVDGAGRLIGEEDRSVHVHGEPSDKSVRHDGESSAVGLQLVAAARRVHKQAVTENSVLCSVHDVQMAPLAVKCNVSWLPKPAVYQSEGAAGRRPEATQLRVDDLPLTRTRDDEELQRRELRECRRPRCCVPSPVQGRLGQCAQGRDGVHGKGQCGVGPVRRDNGRRRWHPHEHGRDSGVSLGECCHDEREETHRGSAAALGPASHVGGRGAAGRLPLRGAMRCRPGGGG
mmetsp:Transcript_1748/g.5764  ORF Transcript_1748/g.5764 Transcript_1748/m.5764 type:complete len:264 (+) Transcript_1748:788-1579(+)